MEGAKMTIPKVDSKSIENISFDLFTGTLDLKLFL